MSTTTSDSATTPVAPDEATYRNDRPDRGHRTGLDRFAPISGLIFILLVLIGGPILEGSAPETGASGASVISFYAAHRTQERAAAIVIAFAFVAFLLFAATLRARWRDSARTEGLSAALLAAAGLVAVGQTITAGIGYSLAQAPGQLAASEAHLLNLLQNDLVLTSAAGFFAFGIVAGAILLRGVGHPRWLGWLAIAIGLLFVSPAELIGLLLLIVWILVLSFRMLRRA